MEHCFRTVVGQPFELPPDHPGAWDTVVTLLLPVEGAGTEAPQPGRIPSKTGEQQ
jgi:hypothetical protein